MAVDLPRGSILPVTHRRSSGLFLLVVLPALTVSLAVPVARGGDGQDRPKSGSQPPGPSRLPDLPIPPDTGMTLDQAVERFLKENLELRAMRDEIPMARAD